MRVTLGLIGAVLCLALTSCATTNPAANLTPEGKAAYYGDKFLRLVETAQAQTIALVGQNGITKADVAPAVEVYVQIFKGGQDLAAALKIIDESNVTEQRRNAALQVRTALDVFQELLANISVRVPSAAARERIGQIIGALKLGAALLDVLQRVGPLLTPPATVSWRLSYAGGVA